MSTAMAYRLRKQAERIERMLSSDAYAEVLRQVAAELRAKADAVEKAE